MSIKRKIALFTAVVILICSMSMIVFAHDVPDMTKTGSIEIAMQYKSEPVAGGQVTIYRVGKILESNGDYRWVKTDEFQKSTFSLKDIQSAKLAAEIEKFIWSHKDILKGITKEIGKDGKVIFDQLELGLYVVVQDEAANGFSTMDAFLVSVPKYENDRYVYDIDAAPKMGEIEKIPETTPESEPTESNPPGGKLPQTGQLNWPVPILIIAGLFIFTAGWVLRFGKNKNI